MPGRDEVVLAVAASKGIRLVSNAAGNEWRAYRIADGHELTGEALEKTLKEIAEEVAKREKATRKEVSVIGPRATYRQFAKDIGANFLDLSEDASTWTKNEELLAGIIERGDGVVFAGKFDPARLDPNSTLAREIQYLIDHGYRWRNDWSGLTKK